MPPKPAGVEDADVAVVTVNFRTPDLTMECLASLRGERAQIPNLSVIVVDGCSEDGSAEKLANWIDVAEYRDWVKFLPLSINGGFGWANNQAVLSLAQEGNAPEFVHFLNPDAEVVPGAVASLIGELMAYPRCGAAGSQLIDADGNRTASAFRFPSVGRELISGAQSKTLARILAIKPNLIESDEGIEVDWVTGASMMFRLDALRETGLFDDGFFLYFEEVELMHRLRDHGWTVRHVPASRVAHHEGSSTGITEQAARRSLPAYWYDSRRRYFALANGPATVVWANVAFAVGRTIAALRSMLGRPSHGGPHIADLLHHGIWPTQRDCHLSVPRVGDVPGAPPRWMID